MILGYVVRPRADKDIDDIADDLAERASLDVGLRFLAAAYESFALIANQPEIGWNCRLRRKVLATARVFRVGEPFQKYLILLHADRVDILRVIHGAQDLEQRLAGEHFPIEGWA